MDLSKLKGILANRIKNHYSLYMKIIIDSVPIEKELLMPTMCNGEREGDGCFIAPGARVNDGVFDYAMIFNVSRLKMLRLSL
jgi:diacylglycerol kinase family enzyme